MSQEPKQKMQHRHLGEKSNMKKMKKKKSLQATKKSCPQIIMVNHPAPTQLCPGGTASSSKCFAGAKSLQLT